jgi:hypothetical protein
MCRLTLSSAMQSHDSHSQTVVTANFWRGDYSCTTPAQPDLGFDPRMTLVFRNWPEKRNLEQERTHTGRVISCW